MRARFRRDAGSIQRLYFDYPTSRRIGVLTGALAAARKPYRCVEAAQLEKVAGTVHHGGIVAIVGAPNLAAATPADAEAWARRGEAVLVLDRVGNAHNLGALARSAAFFGVERMILTDDPATARPNDAAYRVAEGGFEHLSVHLAADLPALLRALAKAGYDVVGASSRGGRMPARSAAAKRAPTALVLGNEERGLDPATAAACGRLVTIGGSGRMESLNVSAAGAVLLAQLLARR